MNYFAGLDMSLKWTSVCVDGGIVREAKIALARRLGVIMHRIWMDGSEFRWKRNGVDDVAA